MSLTRKILFWIVLLLLGGGLSLGVAELLLHLLAQPREKLPGFISRGGFYTYPPGSKFHFTNEDGKEIPIEIDEHGLRNRPGTLAQAEVVLLGDSYIFGINTLQEQTLAGRLRQMGVQAYNAGMGGYSTYNEIFLLRYLLNKAQPKLVVLFFYLGNDFHDNYFVRHNFSAKGAANSGSQVNPSFNLFSEIKHTLGKLCLKSRAGTMLYEQVYCRWFKSPAWKVIASFSLSEMLSYRLAPNADMELAEKKTDLAFGEIARLGREKGIKIQLVGIPSKAQVYEAFHEISNFYLDPLSRDYALETIRAGYSFDRPDRVARALAEKNGLEYQSLLPLFRNHVNPKIYYQIDVHWNRLGQELAGHYLLRTLFKTPKTSGPHAAAAGGAIAGGP